MKNRENRKQVQLYCFLQHRHLLFNTIVEYTIKFRYGKTINWTLKTGDWKLINNTLESIRTLQPRAVEKFLNTIFSNDKKGCSTKCCCRKVGSQCSSTCTNCQSLSCSNVLLNTRKKDRCDFDEVTTDSSSFEQFLKKKKKKHDVEVEYESD